MDKYTALYKLFVATDVPELVFESLVGFILLHNHRSRQPLGVTCHSRIFKLFFMWILSFFESVIFCFFFTKEIFFWETGWFLLLFASIVYFFMRSKLNGANCSGTSFKKYAFVALWEFFFCLYFLLLRKNKGSKLRNLRKKMKVKRGYTVDTIGAKEVH